MNIIRFITEYWDIILLVSTVVITVTAKYIRGELSASNKKLFELVTNAEKAYGAGTGVLKKASVVAQFTESLSLLLRACIGENKISAMVETALTAAKKIWAEDEQLQAYINSNKQ